MSKKDSWDPESLRPEGERDFGEREDTHEGRNAEGWEAFVPEFVKRSLFGGSQQEKSHREESGRGWLPREVARELANIPKEVAREMARVMWAQADRLKTETSKAIANELRRFLSQLDLWQELRKTLDGTALEIEMKVRFRAQEDGQRLEHEVEHLHVERMDPPEEPSTSAGSFSSETHDAVPSEAPQKAPAPEGSVTVKKSPEAVSHPTASPNASKASAGGSVGDVKKVEMEREVFASTQAEEADRSVPAPQKTKGKEPTEL